MANELKPVSKAVTGMIAAEPHKGQRYTALLLIDQNGDIQPYLWQGCNLDLKAGDTVTAQGTERKRGKWNEVIINRITIHKEQKEDREHMNIKTLERAAKRQGYLLTHARDKELKETVYTLRENLTGREIATNDKRTIAMMLKVSKNKYYS